MSKKLMKEKGIKAEILLSDVRKTPFKNNQFDFIASTDVIEHLDNNEAFKDFLDEAYKKLKKNGKLLIHTSPNKLYVDYFYKFYLRYINYLLFYPLYLFTGNKSLKPSLRIRSNYEKKMHVNEQTFFTAKDVLQKSLFKNYMILLFSEPFKFNFLKLPYYIIAYLFPLNQIFPLKLLLSNHIYIEAKKSEKVISVKKKVLFYI